LIKISQDFTAKRL